MSGPAKYDVNAKRAVATRRFWLLAPALVLTVAAGVLLTQAAVAAEEARVIPPPAVSETPAQGDGLKTAVLAGGCFWGVQGVFQHVNGVSNAVSGYAGGERSTAAYDKVGSGRTGHAEAVQITYDPRKISYAQLLQIYFSVGHDPTQLNRQGPDVGSQYRSAIFPVDAEQAKVARAYIGQLNRARAFDAAIVTKIEPERAFYPAEPEHQDFMTRHPAHPYIVVNDAPKVANLKRIFPDAFRAQPVLVGNAVAK